jgi:NADH:ubiquinone oxidoreductase subunit 6 (subunit J)
VVGLALGFVLVGGLGFAILKAPLIPATLPANQGGVPDVVGMALYTQGILLVELAAVLLLVALLGALLIARRPKDEQAIG